MTAWPLYFFGGSLRDTVTAVTCVYMSMERRCNNVSWNVQHHKDDKSKHRTNIVSSIDRTSKCYSSILTVI